MELTCGRCAATDDSFRCESCAVAEVDEAARTRTRQGLTLIAVGIGLSVFAALMWGAGWNPLEDRATVSDGSFGLIGYVAFGAIACFALGIAQLAYRPRLRL